MLKHFHGENHAYIVMEFCEGGDLINCIENNTHLEIKTIFQQIATGIAECHRKGIAHQ